MATIRIAIDNVHNYSADKKTLDTVAEKLRAAGHTVHTHGVGPNQIQGVMRKSSNKCDIAVQIAGGKCLGTMCDFYVGANPNGRYYYADKMGIAFFQCWKPEWVCHREPRDHFSTKPGPVKVLADKLTGTVMTEALKQLSDRFVYGYGETADECAKTLLANISGQTAGTSETVQIDTGNSIIDLIKQVMSDWNKYGAELTLTGDTVNIKRTNPNSAVNLTNDNIINNNISFTDYDNSTPNTYGKIKDNFLVERFGTIPLTTDEVNSTWESQVLQMAQRGHGHSIDLKVILNPYYTEGRWVNLNLPQFNIINRKYYIAKTSLDDERVMSLTLTPGPPEVFMEVAETTDEEIDGTNDDGTTTTEEE